MRYGDGGGVGSAGRVCREQVRRQAVEMFAAGRGAVEVAAVLEVSAKSAYTWRRAWAAGSHQDRGMSGLALQGIDAVAAAHRNR
jgi:transposase-like protein